MRFIKLIWLPAIVLFAFGCIEKRTSKNNTDSMEIKMPADTAVLGVWKRMSPMGPTKIHFKENGVVEIDLDDDNSADVISSYSIKSDTIEFVDDEGKSCPLPGVYKIYHRGYTVSFDVLDDVCNGRIKTTSGFWVRPNYKEQISELSSLIEETGDIEFVLHRGRMYLALGRTELANNDFDTYLEKDSSNAKVYVHRAATHFPYGLKAIIDDCSIAIALDPTDKNAYFLRGLAYYGLGEKQKGCDDFQQSIDLGFEILKEAEYDKCKDYW
jgi:hypothetical protein